MRDKAHGQAGDIKRALADFRAEVLKKAAEADEQAPGVRTLRQVAEEYLEVVEGEGRQTTVESYRHALKRVPATLMDKDVTEVGTHDLDAWAAKLRRRYADSTRKFTVALLHAILEPAFRWERIVVNPPSRCARRKRTMRTRSSSGTRPTRRSPR